jgi:hypothetical protein
MSSLVVTDLFSFPKLLLYCPHQAQADEAHLIQIYLIGEVSLLSTQAQLVLLFSPMAKVMELIPISLLERNLYVRCAKRENMQL